VCCTTCKTVTNALDTEVNNTKMVAPINVDTIALETNLPNTPAFVPIQLRMVKNTNVVSTTSTANTVASNVGSAGAPKVSCFHGFCQFCLVYGVYWGFNVSRRCNPDTSYFCSSTQTHHTFMFGETPLLRSPALEIATTSDHQRTLQTQGYSIQFSEFVPHLKTRFG
jgi:hypothetical protein